VATRRMCWVFAALVCVGVFVATHDVYALPEEQIRQLVQKAIELERQDPPQWESAREIYEALLSQKDYGLKIRERYHQAQRRCLQLRRHQDSSYLREVLSIEYGQATRICKIIHKTLLDGSVEKGKLDPTKLFRKGLEELDAALADPSFVRDHIPVGKQATVPAFRDMVKKTWGDLARLSREDALKQVELVALEAEATLGLSATVATMEMACGACYAIDEFTVFLTPHQLCELARNLSRSEAIGVGIVLAIRDSRIIVGEIAMGSPADLSGMINVEDEIISVNKKPVADVPLLSVKQMLEGSVGSMVEIELQSAGEMRIVRLVRQRAEVPSVVHFMWPGTAYGFLKINSFTDTTVQDVDEAIAKLSKAGMKGLILDLRDNGGGMFESSIDTAQRFLPTGKIITSRQHKDPANNLVYVARHPKALTLPMTVLVDGDTASAAELLAGALKDNDRAYLIGQTTFGKGCTQTLLKLPPATGNVPTGGMRVTVARFLSPKGQPYSGRGVTPHFIIEDLGVPSQANLMGAAYTDKAIQELNRMTMMSK